MRNKLLVEHKIEKVESRLKGLESSFRINSIREFYKDLEDLKDLLEQIKTLLNTESQD